MLEFQSKSRKLPENLSSSGSICAERERRADVVSLDDPLRAESQQRLLLWGVDLDKVNVNQHAENSSWIR